MLVLGLVAVVALSGCAAGADTLPVAAGSHPAGFWLGLWHGFICPITLIVSFFSSTVGIYEVHNNGGWYDFGFVLGASIFFSGSRGPAAARRRSRRPARSDG